MKTVDRRMLPCREIGIAVLLVSAMALAFSVACGAGEVMSELFRGEVFARSSGSSVYRVGPSPPLPTACGPYIPVSTVELIPIAWAEPAGGGLLTVGDTDQDSLGELLTDLYGSFSLFENDGYDNYTLQYAGPSFIPWDVGDADGDGLSDVIGQEGHPAQLWECPTPHSYPSQLVWESEPLSNVFQQSRIVDLDGDGKREILLNRDGLGGGGDVVLFECTGDNSFSYVWGANTSDGNLGWFAVEDFDQDGWMEFAVGDTDGFVHVYECTGDDSYERVAILSTGVWDLYYASEAHDMDGNGRPEFVYGGSINASWMGYQWTIFEATGDNTYAPVDSVRVINGWHGSAHCAVGDTDGDGIEELVVRAAVDLYVYEAIGPENYAPVAYYREPSTTILSRPVVDDLNGNGFAEIVWAGVAPGPPYNPTAIIEDRRAYGEFALALAAPDTVIPQGGTVSFDATVVNREAAPETIDLWTEVYLPGGLPYQGNPLVGPVRMGLAPYDTVTTHLSHVVPLGAPPGDYGYVAALSSSYPLPLLAADTVAFRVVEPSHPKASSPFWR